MTRTSRLTATACRSRSRGGDGESVSRRGVTRGVSRRGIFSSRAKRHGTVAMPFYDARAVRDVPSWRRRTSSRPRTGGGRRWRRRWPAWFSSDGEVSSGSCAVMAGARALAVFSRTVARSAPSLSRKLVSHSSTRISVSASEKSCFARESQLAWRHQFRDFWAPKPSREFRGLINPERKDGRVTIRAI